MSVIEEGVPYTNGKVHEGVFFHHKKDALSPAVVEAIHSGLKRFPHLVIDWNTPTISVAQKLSLLYGSDVFDTLTQSNLPNDCIPKRARHLKPYVMQTVTYDIEGCKGVVTTGMNFDKHSLSHRDESLLLNHVSATNPELAKLRAKKLAEQTAMHIRFGHKTDVDIAQLGFESGYVGPWVTDHSMGNLFISTEITDEDPNTVPVFDMALGNDKSFLLFHPSHPYMLAQSVAESIKGKAPTNLHYRETGHVDLGHRNYRPASDGKI